MRERNPTGLSECLGRWWYLPSAKVRKPEMWEYICEWESIALFGYGTFEISVRLPNGVDR